jgi:hypothetical protein
METPAHKVPKFHAGVDIFADIWHTQLMPMDIIRCSNIVRVALNMIILN